MARPLPLKFAIIGDKSVGKSSLLQYFVRGKCLDEKDDDPDSIEILAKIVMHGSQIYSVTLVDTNASSAHDRVRPMGYYYPTVDVFLICYDITDRQSFNHVSTKWVPEARKHCPTAKLIIVATKLDAIGKGSRGRDIVQETEGRQLGRGVDASLHIQVSSTTGENVEELFDNAVALSGGKYDPSKMKV